jgi:S1-C subfamily serine protease
MSEAPRRKLAVIATAMALVAVACAVAAVLVVVSRGRDERIEGVRTESPGERDVPAVPVIVDQRVKTSMVEQLRQTGSISTIDDGARVNDPALAAAFGLVPGDVITSISGHILASESAVYEAWLWTEHASTLYLEIVRDKRPMLVRVHLEDDLAIGNVGTSSLPPGLPVPRGLAGLGGTMADPLVDTIERVDDTTFRLPRGTLDALLANPTRLATSARIVPSIRNGRPNGVKVYAVRPTSALARLGIQNGDTVHAIADEPVAVTSDPIAIVEKLRVVTSFDIELTRRGKPVWLVYEITK